MLKEVLSLPSISGEESRVRDYILEFAEKNKITTTIDRKGNVYLTKGVIDTMEYYPCVVSHMDTVHRSHIELINENIRLDIKESFSSTDIGIKLTATHPYTGKSTGIGGDDKCGVFVCLSLFLSQDVLKGAFFVEEEIGMLGSREADPSFFEDVGYAIQFDAPSDNWITETCSGVKLFDEGFKKTITPVLDEGGYTKFSCDPFTDVNQLAQKFDFSCLNLGCGYYNQHTDGEYVIVEEVSNSLKMGQELINYLGKKYYLHTKGEVSNTTNNWDSSFSPWEEKNTSQDPWEEYEEVAGDIVDKVIRMLGEEDTPIMEIKEEIVDMLINLDRGDYYY